MLNIWNGGSVLLLIKMIQQERGVKNFLVSFPMAYYSRFSLWLPTNGFGCVYRGSFLSF